MTHIILPRAVVEQVLEALEICRLNGSQYLYGSERDLIFSSITALRTALAQEPHRDIRVALQAPGCERLREWFEIGPVQRAALETFVAALAQKQAEPVYWEVRCVAHPRWMRVDEQQFDEYVAHGWEGQKLYTALPKAEPLTEEEIYAAIKGVDSLRAVEVARAVERALEEKNRGR